MIGFFFSSNTNIFGLTKKGEYEYKYIRFQEKKANTNTNIVKLTKKGEYQFEYKYWGWYSQIQIRIFVTHCMECIGSPQLTVLDYWQEVGMARIGLDFMRKVNVSHFLASLI